MTMAFVHAKRVTLDHHLLAAQSALSAQIVLNTKRVYGRNAKIHVLERVALMLDVKPLIIIQYAHVELDLLATHSYHAN